MFKPGTTLVLSVSAALLMLGVGMIVALLPQRVFAASGSLEVVSLVASIFAAAYLLAQLPIGFLADRIGAKPLLAGGYFLCAVAGVIFYVWRDAEIVLLARAIQGIGEAPVWALGPAILSLSFPATRGRAIGIYNAAIHAGLMCGPLAGLLLSPSGLSQLPFALFAGLALAGGAMTLVFLPASAAGRRREAIPLAALYRALAAREPATILFGIVLYGAAYGTFLSVLPASLSLTHGFDARATSVLFVVFYAAIGLSQLVVGPLCDKLGRDRFMIAGMVAAGLGLAAFPVIDGALAYIPLALASLGLGAFCVASLAQLTGAVPEGLRGAISGGYYLAWGAGYVLGPLAIGVASAQGPRLGYDLLAGAMALVAVLIWRLRR